MTMLPSLSTSVDRPSLLSRVSLYGRLIPGILSCVASIIAIICATIWGYYYLLIPFTLGGLSALYSTYIAWYARHVERLETHHAQLTHSIKQLHTETSTLQQEIAEYTEQNTHYQQANNDLQEAIHTFQQENTLLSTTNQHLEEQERSLQHLNRGLEEKLTLYTQEMHTLQDNIAQICRSAQADYATFSRDLHLLTNQVTHLTQTSEEISSTHLAHEERDAQAITQLLNTARLLESLCTQIGQWKDDTHLMKQIKHQELLLKQTTHLQGLLSKTETQIAKNETFLQAQAEQIQHLQQVKEGFIPVLHNLQEQTKHLSGIHTDLRQEVDKTISFFHTLIYTHPVTL